ncbi:MAG: hypothetical protein ACRCSP_08780 [Rhodoglobus sp.]
MDRPAAMAMVIALLGALLLLMRAGWWARQRRQRDILPPAVAPAELGMIMGSFGGSYVATTASGAPLDRIAVHGLGFRGTVVVVIATAGLLLRLPDRELWIPRTALRALRRATWTIDRVVERDGLHLLEWMLGDRMLDSYLRMTEPQQFEQSLHQLLAERKPA